MYLLSPCSSPINPRSPLIYSHSLRPQEPAADVPSAHPKISYTAFAVDDTALFMPIGVVNSKKTFLAFNSHCPNRYLNTSELDCSKKDFVIGKIVMEEEIVSKGGKEEFGVPKDKPYWLLTCEILN